ncbi:hypothetical protein Tco_0632995 [Tanacetum coccineum]
MQGVRVIRVRMDMGDKEVTKQDLVLKGGDRGDCKLLGDIMGMSWSKRFDGVVLDDWERLLSDSYGPWISSDVQNNQFDQNAVIRKPHAFDRSHGYLLEKQNQQEVDENQQLSLDQLSHPAKAETRGVTRKDIITTQWRLYREFYMQ